MKKSDLRIPAISPRYEETVHDYPISRRENLMMTMNHEKPVYMPSLFGACQIVTLPYNGDMPYKMFEESNDWFGVKYTVSEAYGSNTPVPGMMDTVAEWEEKIKFPDLDAVDWVIPEGFVRDESRALMTIYGNGMFERLHIFEGFENALIDLLEEPEACKDFFNAIMDYKIDLFRRMDDLFDFDIVMYNDDWGTAKGPFFSKEVFEDLILEPSIRYAEAVHERDCKLFFHNCGKIDMFIPYLVDDIKADALEIQTINDYHWILDNYGDRITLEMKPDNYVMYDPDTTVEEIKEHARNMVDEFGATAVPGSGVINKSAACNAELHNAFLDEIYTYSLEKYKTLR